MAERRRWCRPFEGEKAVHLLRNVGCHIPTRFLAFALLIVASSLVADEHALPWRNLELVIQGDRLQACATAYQDFVQKLAAEPSIADTPLGRYLSDPANYDIEVSVGKSTFYVYIRPRQSEEFPGVFGGDAEYVIDAKTFKILEKGYGK